MDIYREMGKEGFKGKMETEIKTTKEKGDRASFRTDHNKGIFFSAKIINFQERT